MTNSVTVVANVFSNTLIFFAAKMWLAMLKLLTFFSAKKINVFAMFQDRNFNILLANNFVKFLNDWALSSLKRKHSAEKYQ